MIIADPPPGVTTSATSVYRYYDQNNLLLYVGITSRGGQRNREHNATKEWWPFVVRQDVEHYPTRAAATAREKNLIRAFHPPFNKQHNPDYRDLQAIYRASAGRKIVLVPRDANRVLAAVHHKLPLSRVGDTGTRAIFTCQPEHHVLAEVLRWDDRVILRAPKKVAVLTGIETAGVHVAFEFEANRRIPALRDVRLHVKVRARKPLVVDIHEAVGEVAA